MNKKPNQQMMMQQPISGISGSGIQKKAPVDPLVKMEQEKKQKKLE